MALTVAIAAATSCSGLPPCIIPAMQQRDSAHPAAAAMAALVVLQPVHLSVQRISAFLEMWPPDWTEAVWVGLAREGDEEAGRLADVETHRALLPLAVLLRELALVGRARCQADPHSRSTESTPWRGRPGPPVVGQLKHAPIRSLLWRIREATAQPGKARRLGKPMLERTAAAELSA
mmetsp:Transcript_35930/g.101778  ORF Transcript_35930/g.101778 Transcript_35930/m.101778 type:complete len:177 (+) Transcript_35930:1822-2352(+)